MDAKEEVDGFCKVALPAARSDSGLLFLFRSGLPEGKLLIGLSDHVYCGTGACIFRSEVYLIGIILEMMKVMEMG
jgi:hypothetical protein